METVTLFLESALHEDKFITLEVTGHYTKGESEVRDEDGTGVPAQASSFRTASVVEIVNKFYKKDITDLLLVTSGDFFVKLESMCIKEIER